MGLLDSVARVLGSLRPTDEQLAAQHEALRVRYVSTQDVGKATRLWNAVQTLDAEMIRRANKAYFHANPNPPAARHREHGWYLPNDD